ncbi:methyltransferase family protein [Burkholderia sp. LA-2-3-30-S1-D2]|uniref:methyltransferase family protein n=1 Tax=Burkholderia sp. LA-2-3-30-S1-D2 TaxID=1637862 RepID=UPI00075C0F80|nr:isoprenylcysteine carboxylmethyltransferase family protein [Burkholderia sp. LA-2-3-30-S1-D2]AOI94346.1 isoprenylcysteine carboxyl methyltransferase [Burkholderia sp. LA-2-3-30-S1-D2]KVE10716.1 isoprenylcysteine carboxyl methyltransferase [Burkholderia sp. LA-2-3-30-S1-D2]
MAVTRKFAIAASVSTLVYLGLAVLGIGGFAAFFAHPQLTVIAVATLALAAVALLTEGNLSAGERENRDNRWVLAAFGASGLLLAYVPALTDRLDVWTFGATVRWIGVVLYVAGGVLRIWPVFVLGKRFSGLVAIQPGHTLVTDGIYRRIRNPSYLGLLVNAAGWALAFRSGVGLLLVALTMIPLVARIRSEEALLRAQFGAEYDAYCAHTWRLIPGVY